MKIFELKHDGKLARHIVNEVGDEYSVSERLKNKILGVGHLQYITGNAVLDEFYDRHNRTIKTHFDWTKKGAVIRVRTMANLYAVGLSDEGLTKIELTKNPDYIYAFPFMPFWMLLKLGTPIAFAKWFKFRGDKFDKGKCEITIQHFNDVMTFELAGDLWADCVTTFKIARAKNIITIDDKRTWMTENGFRVNSGTRQ